MVPSQIPRSRPTSDILRSARRSAATDGGMPSESATERTFAVVSEDLLSGGPGTIEVKPSQFIGDLDDAARVDDVVRREDDAPVGEQLLYAVVGELVVGSAADDARGEHAGDLLGQRTAQRARGQDVQSRGQQRVDAGHCADFRVAGADGLGRFRADVADHHLSPGLEEVVDEPVADLPDAFHAHGPATQAGAAPGVLGRRLHPVQ